MFNEIDFNMENDEILNIMEENIYISSKIKNEIKIANQLLSDVKNNDTTTTTTINEEYDDNNIDLEMDYEFEDRVEFFLSEYKNIKENFEEEELLDVLPFYNDYNILLRLCAESMKEISEIEQIAMLDITTEDMNDCYRIIEHEKRKIGIIKKIINSEYKIDESTSEVKNEIILAPNLNGKSRIILDLEGISSEYYSTFKELIESAINGTFKGVKVFINNPSLSGICELRKNKARILFKRISRKKYVLINAFIKKTTLDNGYLDFLKTRVSSYKEIHDKLKMLITDEDFLSENEAKLDELFQLLSLNEKSNEDSSEKSNIKIIKKGGK